MIDKTGSTSRGGPLLAPAVLLCVCGLIACAEPVEQPVAKTEAESAAAVRVTPDLPEIFTDAALEMGLDFEHDNGMAGEYNYPEMMGSGVALLDYDDDGDLDVYLVQGAALGESSSAHSLPLSDRLYRNDLVVSSTGERLLRFTDVTAESGIEATGYGMGVAAADFNNDGRVDLYITNVGANQLLLNQGSVNGGAVTFVDATATSGTGDPSWGVSVAVLDFDRDGWLDLYVGNYVEWSPRTNPRCTDELGMVNYCGPLSFKAAADTLYRNLGATQLGADSDGVRFADISRRAGVRDEYGGALGVVVADFDDDGWPDLYVANDGLPNQLWRNNGWSSNGAGGFTNQALLAGCAVNGAGQPEASMGLAAADFDGDGDEDLFLTHLDQETNTVYVNDGRGFFADRSVESGLGSPSFSSTGFGTAWFDYDNDGWLDLMAVNGAVKVIKSQALAGEDWPLGQKNQLFHGRGDGGFEEVSDRAGRTFALLEVSRGAAFGDLDNDGDTDVVVANNSGPARLLLNQVGSDQHWLGLRVVVPVAGGAVRDDWGARVSIFCADTDSRKRRRRVGSMASYASSSDPRLLFGLGDQATVCAAGDAQGAVSQGAVSQGVASQGAVSRIRVRWSDGKEEEWDDLKVDRYTTLRQGSGRQVGGSGS